MEKPLGAWEWETLPHQGLGAQDHVWIKDRLWTIREVGSRFLRISPPQTRGMQMTENPLSSPEAPHRGKVFAMCNLGMGAEVVGSAAIQRKLKLLPNIVKSIL